MNRATAEEGTPETAAADVAALWQRFQEAAQKAYQPCREYFEAQGQVRQENLQRRAALLERLSAFVAGHDQRFAADLRLLPAVAQDVEAQPFQAAADPVRLIPRIMVAQDGEGRHAPAPRVPGRCQRRARSSV